MLTVEKSLRQVFFAKNIDTMNIMSILQEDLSLFQIFFSSFMCHNLIPTFLRYFSYL
jgi:hypothetical protein